MSDLVFRLSVDGEYTDFESGPVAVTVGTDMKLADISRAVTLHFLTPGQADAMGCDWDEYLDEWGESTR